MSDNELGNVNEVETSAHVEGSQMELPMPEKLSDEQVVEKSTKGQEFMLRLVDRNRKKGIEQLTTKLDSLAADDRLDAMLENTLRNVRSALQAGLTSIEAINSFCEFLRHDLIALAQNLNTHAKQQWHTGAHLQTLIKALVDKNVLSQDELEKTWQAIMAEAQKVPDNVEASKVVIE